VGALRIALAVAAAGLLVACVPPAPEDDVGTSPRYEPVELLIDGFDRHARNTTYRIRNVGCLALSTGSGFALDPYTLVTNRHVVEGARRLQLSTWDGRDVEVAVRSVAFANDLAVVTTSEPMETSVSTGRTPALGASVYAAGYPGGGPWQLRQGTVLDVLDGRGFGETSTVIRSSATVGPGSSGGPLFDEHGKVVGVIYAMDVGTADSLAIPVEQLSRVLLSRSLVASNTACPAG
jgi:S1-C subfamily serine protease